MNLLFTMQSPNTLSHKVQQVKWTWKILIPHILTGVTDLNYDILTFLTFLRHLCAKFET